MFGLFLFGLIFFGLGMTLVAFERKARAGTFPVKGRLVGYTTRPNGFHSVVEFPGVDGRLRLVESRMGSTPPMGFVGQEKTVLLRPGQPDYAVVDTRILSSFGIGSCAIGAVSLAGFWSSHPGSDPTNLLTGALVLFVAARPWFRQSDAVGTKRPPITALTALAGSHGAPASIPVEERAQLPMASEQLLAENTARQERQRKFSAPFLLLIALVPLAGAAFSFKTTKEFLAVARPAQGVVVRLEARHGNKGGVSYAPVVEYRVPGSGQLVQFRHSVASNPPAYSPGQMVNVLYDPRNPREARIDLGGLWNYSLPGGFFLAGVFLLWLALWRIRGPRMAAPVEDAVRFRKTG